ncbi:O-antigen ligase family protein [Ascidiimonas aurantiaca]|uniref:O-antigen ligase family protein n=1 Tax=Ascidiimonas aurantiaca TaxID=1685432 RepID=UPI0030EE50FE
MKKATVILFFIWPFIFSALNVQVLISKFVSVPLSQVFAYGNVLLLIIGIFTQLKQPGTYSKTATMWFVFYISYYVFGLIATAYHGVSSPIMRTLIPVVYFAAFYFFFKQEENQKFFAKVLMYTFLISSIFTILMFKKNFDIDYGGVHIYKLDRAGGLYGDANNAALVCILSFLLIKQFFVAKTRRMKLFKYFLYGVVFYSLVLTFSTTGLSVFIITFVLSNQKFFNKQRLFLLAGLGVVGFILILNLKTLTADMPLTTNQRYKIENLVNVVTLSTDEVDNSGRGELLSNLLETIYENPFLGNGIDHSVVMRGHNTYMGIWADAGLITFIIFCFILISFFVKSLKLKGDDRSFCLSTLIVFYIFMLSLQTILNQPYLIIIFVFLAYLIDGHKKVAEIRNLPVRESNLANKKYQSV